MISHITCIKCLFFISILSTISTVLGDIPCAERNEDYESLVCVCNATYCDEISKIVKQPPGTYIMYASSRDGLRFDKKEGKLENYSADPPKFPAKSFQDKLFVFVGIHPDYEETIFDVNRFNHFQKIVGFGAAFTDSASINYRLMNDNVKNKIITSYFSENGIEYNMGKVPIAGTDFSTHPYAYNMQPEYDVSLSNFSLTEEDFRYKVPFIKAAQKSATDEIYLIAAAWSPPPWMKTSHNIGRTSFLLTEYYQTWADYHLKFLEEYKKLDLSFWAISTGNEPSLGIIAFLKEINSLGWTPNMQAKWIAENLGPTIKNDNKFKDVKILAMDDQRIFLPLFNYALSREPKTMDYVDGFSTHWYLNIISPPILADLSHFFHNDRIIISSAASSLPLIDIFKNQKVSIGSWTNCEHYIKEIINDLNHWYVAWLDWNLVVDRQGGPNWFYNFADAPIITFPEKEEFIKQPTFYAMGHFSKFIPRDSIRIDSNKISGIGVSNVAFLRPDGGIAVIVLNSDEFSRFVTIRDKDRGKKTFEMSAHSVVSFVYW